MERNTKRIIAIVAILVIAGAGIGVGVWFLLTPPASVYVTPGVSGIPDNRIIKVGLLGGITDIQGKGNYEGAWLAAYNINTAGGVQVNGTTYYIGLVSEDTDESNPVLDVTKGVSAAEKILAVDGAQYIVGGFRTEALKAYLEVVMDAKKLFLGTGASTDYFCYNVYGAAYSSYSRYKYWFRVMPINSTSLGSETIREILYLAGYMSDPLVLNKTIHKVAIIREALDWTIPMDTALNDVLPLYGFTITNDIAYPITATATDFATYWNQIEAAGAQITIPIISAQGGIYMMTQYAALHPQCLIAGIDVQSQLDTFWGDTTGDCAYEIIMQSVLRTNKSALTVAFWDDFVATYNHEPLYTAVGAYDAVNLIAEAINATGSFRTQEIIPYIESFTKASPQAGASVTAPYSAWNKAHDVSEGYPYGFTLFCQWKPDSTKDCISAPLVYPDVGLYGNIVTGGIALPPWGINDP
ncbi:MAG: ABC transporter substrate-binding protein [Promethearchaeota archaeon]